MNTHFFDTWPPLNLEFIMLEKFHFKEYIYYIWIVLLDYDIFLENNNNAIISLFSSIACKVVCSY